MLAKACAVHNLVILSCLFAAQEIYILLHIRLKVIVLFEIHNDWADLKHQNNPAAVFIVFYLCSQSGVHAAVLLNGWCCPSSKPYPICWNLGQYQIAVCQNWTKLNKIGVCKKKWVMSVFGLPPVAPKHLWASSDLLPSDSSTALSRPPCRCNNSGSSIADP